MSTSTIPAEAAVGRRVAFSHINDPKRTEGVITHVAGPDIKVRLDGQRSNLHLRADYEGLRYLAEIVPVPVLPMGRFQPSTQHAGIDYEYDGVLVVEFDEGDMAAITSDRAKAEGAVATYLREQAGIDDETTVRDELAELQLQWVVFEWQPEGAECDWLMNPAAADDDESLQVYYLPVA